MMVLKELGDIVGNEFRVGRLAFKVLEGIRYPWLSVTRRYRRYLKEEVSVGSLVAVSFYGKRVPLITAPAGVIRLREVMIDAKTVRGSEAISRNLGLKKTKAPVYLRD